MQAVEIVHLKVTDFPATNPVTNCIFYLMPEAGRALANLIMAPAPGADTYHGDDWNQMFVNNRWVANALTGRTVRFVNSTSTTRQRDTELECDFSSGEIQLNPQDLLAYCSEPWDKVLRVHNTEKDLVQALSVGVPDELLVWAFEANPELLPDQLRPLAANLRAAQSNQPMQYNTQPQYAPAAQTQFTVPVTQAVPQTTAAPPPAETATVSVAAVPAMVATAAPAPAVTDEQFKQAKMDEINAAIAKLQAMAAAAKANG